jgi:osmotically-inducible protein OsmY
MRKFISGLALGIILGALAFWLAQTQARQHAQLPQPMQPVFDSATNAGATAGQAAAGEGESLKAQLEVLGLNPDKIMEELSRTGAVVRRKAVDIGDQAADAASDLRATAEIKAKFAADPDLSAWKISVACSQGHVALAGTVASPGEIGRAVALALEADGVRDVTSSLLVKPV